MPEKSKKTGLRVDQMWAWLSIDPADDQEGVCAIYDEKAGFWHPLVGADEARMRSLQPHAVEIAKKSGQKVRLVCFRLKEIIQEIDP